MCIAYPVGLFCWSHTCNREGDHDELGDINMAQSGLLWEFDECWVDYHRAGFRLVRKGMGNRRLFSWEVQKSSLLKEQTVQLSTLDVGFCC